MAAFCCPLLNSDGVSRWICNRMARLEGGNRNVAWGQKVYTSNVKVQNIISEGYRKSAS